MRIIKDILKLFLVILIQFVFIPVKPIYAASSPSLGEAASFAILAGTEITNVPTSVITGDVGLSPAAGSNYSGLNTSEVSGTIFAPDSSGPDGSIGNDPTMLTTAKNDLVTAYDALALGANADANCDAGYTFGGGNVDLSGASLAPGVYCADTFTLTGTLTLTGSGVWVFRSAASLITSGTANIVGGDACNVWWQVPSSATFGTNTSFTGNVLALTSVTMTTGASLNGRVLARNGAVTLQSNTISQTCTSARAIPVNQPLSDSGSSSYCPPLDSNIVAPVVIDSKRVDSDSIYLSWGPYSGTNEFNVRYGTINGDWKYSTDVTGFSTTINSLPSNQPIWVQVAGRNNCNIGEYGAVYGTAKFIGIPKLPNTGFGSYFNYFLNYFKYKISFFL